MNQQQNEIRDQQQASWNKFSAGWKKWDDITMSFLKPMGNQIIQLLNLKDSEVVLDIASGTGEPGLTIASMLKSGKVVLTDLSQDMLIIAIENAKRKEITNVETKVCDVCELPFPDSSFDAISCRFGFMFFPDMKLAVKEMMRVLKPGGRIATAVWSGPDKNYWVTAMGGPINKIMEIPSPAPDAPGMFRCAANGFLKELFSQQGLKNTSETEVFSKLHCGTTDIYWNMMTEIAAPFVAALSNADDTTKIKIKEEVFKSINEKYVEGSVEFDASALIIYGEK